MGFGFLNSLFLVALTATALPIIIHILNRRRVRKIEFSSLEFIFELSKRRMSKINLRRWLILLLRTLAVAFLVLGFARPTMQSNAAFFMPGDTPKHVVVCIDVSANMGVEKEQGTAFTVAKRVAGEVIDESGRNDLVNIVAFSSQAEPLFESGTRNKQIAKKAIEGLRQTAEGTSYPRALDTALELARQGEVKPAEIYLISDFRESPDSVLVTETPADARVVLLPVYKGDVDNVSIDRVFMPRKLIRPGEVIRVGVSVTNHSRVQPANFPLELFIGGSRKAEKVMNLSPATSMTVNFAVSLNDWGSHRCRVAKNRDRLPVDDDRFFLLEVSRRIPVTLIRGRKYADSDQQRAASYFFVDKALNPRGSGEGEFSVEAIDERNLTASSLPGKGVVVWTDPRDLDRRRFELFKRYIQGGGSALVFLGPEKGPLWENGDFLGYLGIQRATVRQRADGERFASFQNQHPIFALFNEDELELLTKSRVRSYVSASGVAPDSILAYLGSGDAGVWECRRGRGRLIVVATAPDMMSGDLPLSPMFLPLIHTSVSYLSSPEGADPYTENYVGAQLVFDLPASSSTQSAALSIVDEHGESYKPLLYETDAGEHRVMLARPRTVGFYKLVADTAVVAQAPVNVDTRESNLNARELDPAHVGAASIVDTGVDLAANLEQDKQGREVFVVFLLLAVSALVLESFLGRNA